MLDHLEIPLPALEDPARALLAQRLRQAGMHRQGSRIESCGKRYSRRVTPTGDIQSVPWRCRQRFCPTCKEVMRRSELRKLHQRFNSSGLPAWRGVFGTLTLPSAGPALDQASRIRGFLTALPRKAAWKTGPDSHGRRVALVTCLEVSRGAGEWGHVHVHLLILAADLTAAARCWEWVKALWMDCHPGTCPEAQCGEVISTHDAQDRALAYLVKRDWPQPNWPAGLLRNCVQLLSDGKPLMRLAGKALAERAGKQATTTKAPDGPQVPCWCTKSAKA